MRLSYLLFAAIFAIFIFNPTQYDSKNKLVMITARILEVQNGAELKFCRTSTNYKHMTQLDSQIPENEETLI